jgi:hypothetical protein
MCAAASGLIVNPQFCRNPECKFIPKGVSFAVVMGRKRQNYLELFYARMYFQILLATQDNFLHKL